ncbi:MAG: collagen-like protein, partial [Vicinamibacterales bacterium]
GATGATGPAGPAGGIAEFGYVYNLGAQVVPIEADITFDSNGLVTDGVSHSPGSSTTVITNAGVYEIGFSVSGVEPNQFAIFINGTSVDASIHGSGAGTQQNNGHVLVVLSAGDVITLRNHSSAAAVTLQTLAGGTQNNVNASLLIRKLN